MVNCSSHLEPFKAQGFLNIRCGSPKYKLILITCTENPCRLMSKFSYIFHPFLKCFIRKQRQSLSMLMQFPFVCQRTITIHGTNPPNCNCECLHKPLSLNVSRAATTLRRIYHWSASSKHDVAEQCCLLLAPDNNHIIMGPF